MRGEGGLLLLLLCIECCGLQTVQLMLTFQVPQRLIAQFIAQVLDQYHWSSEYEPMCEHLWESIKSGISGYDK